MRGKFGFIVVLLAAAAWLAAESTSYAGRCHRRARRGGCQSACNTGCGSYSGCGQATGCGDCYSGGGQEMAPAPPAPNADSSPSDGGAPPPPPAPDQGAQADPTPDAPAVQAGTTQRTANTYYGNRRARRGWSRR